MATVSEKKNRGRPKKYAEMEIAVAEHIMTSCVAKSGRSRNNYLSMGRALRAVMDVPGLEWICDSEEVRAGRKRLRHTILIELGRLDDIRLIYEVALQICERKPTTKEAQAIIREYRQVRRRGSRAGLLRAICRTIDDYRRDHLDFSADDVREVVALLAQELESPD